MRALACHCFQQVRRGLFVCVAAGHETGTAVHAFHERKRRHLRFFLYYTRHSVSGCLSILLSPCSALAGGAAARRFA